MTKLIFVLWIISAVMAGASLAIMASSVIFDQPRFQYHWLVPASCSFDICAIG